MRFNDINLELQPNGSYILYAKKVKFNDTEMAIESMPTCVAAYDKKSIHYAYIELLKELLKEAEKHAEETR